MGGDVMENNNISTLHRALADKRRDACRRNCAAVQPDGWLSGEDRHMPHWVCPSCRNPQVTPVRLMIAALGRVENWHPMVIRAMQHLSDRVKSSSLNR